MVISEELLRRLKDQLIFCPTCGWRLDNHETLRDIRVCVNHGDIFRIRGEGNSAWAEIRL